MYNCLTDVCWLHIIIFHMVFTLLFKFLMKFVVNPMQCMYKIIRLTYPNVKMCMLVHSTSYEGNFAEI